MHAQLHSSYLRWLAFTLLAGCLLAMAFVVVIDPYGLYHVVQRPGMNEVKPSPTRYRNEIKLAAMRHLNAEQILVGNSRIEVGFDPESATLGPRAFNLGLAGTGAITAVGQLEYLRGEGIKPKRLIAGLEFMDALLQPGQRPSKAMRIPQPSPELAWRFDTVFSLSSLKDALTTLAIQRDGEAETMTGHGFNPLKQYEKFARVDGYYKIFQQRAEESARAAVRKAAGQLDGGAVREELRAMLDAAARDNPGVDVHLVIYAYHAQMLAMFEQSGLWPRFEQWKDILIEEVAAARLRHPQARIALHDFSGYGYFNCESIPGPGERRSTKWYWEAGHLKSSLGEVMMQRMLAPTAVPAQLNDAERIGFAQFGTVLEASTREANRQRIADERQACSAAHPGVFSDMQTLVTSARQRATTVH